MSRSIRRLHVNASQSTADVCHTASRIAIINRWARAASRTRVLVVTRRAIEGEAVSLDRNNRADLSAAMRARSSLGEIFGALCARRSVAAPPKSIARCEALQDQPRSRPRLATAVARRRCIVAAVIARLNQLTENETYAARRISSMRRRICDDLAAVAAQLALARRGPDQSRAGLAPVVVRPRGRLRRDRFCPRCRRAPHFFRAR